MQRNHRRFVVDLSRAATLILIVLVAGAAAGQTRTDSRVRGFLLIPGIPGDSQTRPKSIELRSVAWGPSRAPRPSITTTEVHVRKRMDKASPLIAKALQARRRFPVVRLVLPAADGTTVSREVSLFNATISSHQTTSESESVTFVFEKMVWRPEL